MQPGKMNLLISKKATFEHVFYVLTSHDKTKLPNDPAQVAVDLTGCTGVALVKDKVGGTTVVTLSVTFPNPTIGQVQLGLTAAQTTALNFKTAVWDLFITFPSGKVVKYVEGNVTLDPNVS